MTELIERLEECRKQMTFGDTCLVCSPEVIKEIHTLSVSNIDAIISALKDQQTLQGIEELAKENPSMGTTIWAPCPHISENNNQWLIFKNEYGRIWADTLAIAVEEAKKKVK
jgi:hypothetical protein